MRFLRMQNGDRCSKGPLSTSSKISFLSGFSIEWNLLMRSKNQALQFYQAFGSPWWFLSYNLAAWVFQVTLWKEKQEASTNNSSLQLADRIWFSDVPNAMLFFIQFSVFLFIIWGFDGGDGRNWFNEGLHRRHLTCILNIVFVYPLGTFTYPTVGKGKSSCKIPLERGICYFMLFPRRVPLPSARVLFFFSPFCTKNPDPSQFV